MSFKEQLDDDLTEVFFKTGENEDGDDVSEFAEVIVYRPGGVALDGYEVSAIVDMSTETPQPQGSGYATVQTTYVRAMVKEADIVGGSEKGDTVVVREVEYEIVEANSDGVGVITLMLHKR